MAVAIVLSDVGLDERMALIAPHFNGLCQFVHSAEMVRCLIDYMGPSAEHYLHYIRASSPGHASFAQERI